MVMILIKDSVSVLGNLDSSDVIALFSLIVAIIAIAWSYVQNRKNRWIIARDFLKQFDSADMRRARKLIYSKYKKCGNGKGLSVKKIIKDKELEDAITNMISIYDGNAMLVLNGTVPKKLYDGMTLYTAVQFYKIVLPYITYRRKKDNKLYACNYVELLSNKSIRKEISKINSRIENKNYYDIILDSAYENVKALE